MGLHTIKSNVREQLWLLRQCIYIETSALHGPWDILLFLEDAEVKLQDGDNIQYKITHDVFKNR